MLKRLVSVECAVLFHVTVDVKVSDAAVGTECNASWTAECVYGGRQRVKHCAGPRLTASNSQTKMLPKSHLTPKSHLSADVV